MPSTSVGLCLIILPSTFAKKRMSKALSVKKKMRSGRTDRQTHRHTDTQTHGSFYQLCRDREVRTFDPLKIQGGKARVPVIMSTKHLLTYMT